MMTILLVVAVAYLVFTLVAAAVAYWPDPDREIECAVTEELSRRQFKARVDAEVARRDEKGGQK